MFSWSSFPSVYITSATLELLRKAGGMWTNPRRARWLCLKSFESLHKLQSETPLT